MNRLAREAFTINSPHLQLPTEAMIEASDANPSLSRIVDPWWTTRNDSYLRPRGPIASGQIEVFEMRITDRQHTHGDRVRDDYHRTTRIERSGAVLR